MKHVHSGTNRQAFLLIIILLLSFTALWGRGHQVQEPGDAPGLEQHEVTSGEEEFTGDTRPAESHAGVQQEEGHGADLSPLLFIIIALFIGAATRHFLRKSPLPYTVSLLLIGLGVGAATRLGWFDTWSLPGIRLDLGFIGRSVEWAGHIDPHVILYVFLPTLVFEAAFAMDVHTFRKSFGNATILAVPGIIIAMVLTAALVIGLDLAGIGLPGWGWTMAFMFGAVVSATDPVAVVSLLKELGASKKLGTLIEGESLLNDGTAIVIFMVFFVVITGESSGASPVVEFLRVSLGGTLVGIVIGALAISWVRRVFNDALVEISVIIASAYATFYVCENFFHISGVLGLVALGLAMASVGRTRISPEVEHFLHEFWELAAFIANTLIFIIVGVVIAQQAKVTAQNFLILGIIYLGVHIIRAVVIALFYPAMKKIGYGLSLKDSYVLWWGALRGAIGLSLALIVAGESRIPLEIREQFLFLTAGLVTLTLLVNATTIKYLVNRLGLTKVSPAIALIRNNAGTYLIDSVENAVEKIKEDRFMNRANWGLVKEYMPRREGAFHHADLKIETIAELRRRVLEKEKSSYWHQFRDGLLGPVAVRRLSDAINEILDAGGMIPLSARKDLEESWKTPRLLDRMQSLPLLGILSKRAFFEKLSISYDSARGFVEAQEEAIKLVESMYRSLKSEGAAFENEEQELAVIEEEINVNKIHGLTFLRNLRKNFPEIYTAIATRQAIRTMLNYERRTVERLEKNGRIDAKEAAKMTESIEERMKKLMDSPPAVALPDALDLLRDVPWLQGLDPDTLHSTVALFQTRVYSVGERIIREAGHSDGLYFIARGTVKVTLKGEVVDVIGQGNFIGEMAGLLGTPRTAEVVAESPVTALWMSNTNMNNLVKTSPLIEERLWRIGATRLAENILREQSPYNQWKQTQLRNLVSKGKVVTPDENTLGESTGRIVILLTGTAKEKEMKKPVRAPAVISPEEVILSTGAKLFIC